MKYIFVKVFLDPPRYDVPLCTTSHEEAWGFDRGFWERGEPEHVGGGLIEVHPEENEQRKVLEKAFRLWCENDCEALEEMWAKYKDSNAE